MSRLRSLPIAVVAMLLLGAGRSASAGDWERIHGDFRRALLDLSGRLGAEWKPDLPAPGEAAASPGSPRVVVVGFTGWLEPHGPPDSGIRVLTRRINGMGDQGVVALLFGQGESRQAAAEVLGLAHDARVQGYICSAVRILLRLSAEGADLQGRSESLR